MGAGFMETDPKLALSDVNESLANSVLTAQERKQRRRAIKCKSEGVAFMRSSLPAANVVMPFLPALVETKQESTLETLSELVHVPAKVSHVASVMF
jgi:hypothetical protein